MRFKDEWCDLCRDKMKAVGVLYGERKIEIGICEHCYSLCSECAPYEEKKS